MAEYVSFEEDPEQWQDDWEADKKRDGINLIRIRGGIRWKKKHKQNTKREYNTYKTDTKEKTKIYLGLTILMSGGNHNG